MGWLNDLRKLQPSDLDPTNEKSKIREALRTIDRHVLQPFWNDVLGNPIAQAYIQYVEGQARGKYKSLPRWLKLILQEKASYDIDLTEVSYAEGIDTLQSGNAITFGYCIHFPTTINLDDLQPNRDDVHWMLHELEHVVQYKRIGGVNAFVIKYVVQATITGSWKGDITGSWKENINNIHDNMDIERDAANKADSLLDSVLQKLSELSRVSEPMNSLVAPSFQKPILQTGTTLHNTDDTFDFAMADWNGDGRPDLVAIKKSNTGTNSTEVHILSGASNFQDFILHKGTALHNTDNTFDFAMADWNGDGRPDLVAIKKSNTGANSTEVHILSGASNFQDFILHTGTALHNTDDTFDFAMADWNGDGRPDLVAIKKSNTGANSTEVHILSGASNFQEFILHTGTTLHNTDDTFDFAMADWNGDGRPDLVAIKKSNTNTNSTEVHILSGASNFQDFILHTGTALHNTDDTFDFAMANWNGDGRPDLVAIKKSNTGTNSTEVHVFAG
ncbi:hypothetical protein N7491_004743 [Penicillium cf. griseofulvum]|uniref:DUF4157 domain-containing protein n=1 Tax=Penicillium cf. griseofulvum TaxID=2972120 RepID=A0A9W9J1V9_9EURO|nr:hypothetical protein N7472_007432 [Penicillium cf. griseofulvum]KAJ5434148.1 hypothetical protein N7491_004743 [Penicillium cf. griseofulvum]KAJ5451975.1 hypothetical protein N7445_000158 [Penicillium cf. griseofulvum]